LLDNTLHHMHLRRIRHERRLLAGLVLVAVVGAIVALVSMLLTNQVSPAHIGTAHIGTAHTAFGRVDPRLREVMLGWMNRSRAIG
jgi:hypothetical protein